MGSDKTSLGDRMKNYESINRSFLIPKLHTVLRLDGRAFHTYTKQFTRPFDDVLINMMDETAKYLCDNIQGAKFAFVQSDEISIYLSDTDELETQMWYKGNIQKIVSVSAAIATSKFNHLMFLHKLEYISKIDEKSLIPYYNRIDLEDILKPMALAEFDSRVFQLPNEEEVVNCLLWRQQDCTRNSIQSVAQSLYSQQELDKKNTNMLQELIFQKGINWDSYSAKLKRGRFITKNIYINNNKAELVPSISGESSFYMLNGKMLSLTETDVIRSKWESVECPIFSKDRKFILDKM